MGLPAEVKEEEQRQAGLVRAQSAGQGDTGGIARAEHIVKSGHGQANKPAVARPFYLSAGDYRATDNRVCLIQPPNNLPMPDTMRLTCSY